MEKKQIREKVIEDYLRLQVKHMGGRAYKFSSPGNAGVPDRLVVFPGGKIAFVELKAPGRKPTVKQNQKMQELRHLGAVCTWTNSKEGVDQILKELQDGI